MTPVLYENTEGQFNHMGIGALADATSCLVHEARNGAFELTLTYPVDGPLYGELIEDRIIKAKANDDANMAAQLFRIYKSGKPLNGLCTFYAEHITGALAKNPITHVSVSNGTAQQFGQAILANTVYPHPFSFVSSDATVTSSDLSRVPAAQALVGIEGSLIDRWRGELTRDNFVIREEQNRGEDTGIIIEYGKNLTDATQEKAIDETYTSIYPYATVNDADGNSQVIELPEKIIESPYVGNYAYGRCLPIDLSGDDVTDETSLRSKAQAYVTQNDFGKPKVNLTINFIQLWQMEEYKNVAPLEHVNLCDWVTVRFKKIGIDAKVKVIDGVFDSLVEKWTSMELGDAQSDWQSSVQSTISDVSATANQAAKVSGYALIQANGKNRNFYSETFPTEGMITNDILFMKVNGQYLKKYHYDGIQWVLDVSADANDALEAANQAMESANGKARVWRQAAEPTEGMQENDMWFRTNADGTVTIKIYQDGVWGDPTLDGVKAAQDQANAAVATADAASVQAISAAQDAATAINTANAANSAAIAAQQTAGDAATQASSAWNKAQDAWDEAILKADADSVYTKTEIDNALTGYASTTTVNTLTGRVDQAETAISENENAISLKADKSTVNTLTGQVSTMSAELTTQAGEIAARITSQDADAKYATQTSLTATSNSLTSSISAVQTNLNNLQVGGRNLIRNSDFSTGNYNNWGYEVDAGISVQPDSTFSKCLVAKVATAGKRFYSTSNPFAIGNTYVISFYAKAASPASISVGQLGNTPFTTALTTSWARYSFVFTANNTYTLSFYLQTINVDYYVTRVQVTNGNKLTDWQPAPEDMATVVQFSQLSQTLDGLQTTVSNKLDTATYNSYVSQTASTLSGLLTKTDAASTYTTKTSFNATVDGINTTVSKKLDSTTAASTYATKSSLTQTATSLQTNIDAKVGTDTYNSKISQLSNDINARVVKNDVVHQINISTEGILIDGSKTHITGQTTIDEAVITHAMIASVDLGKATVGELNGNRLVADSVTTRELNVANLAAISANLGWITAGTINGVQINGSVFQMDNDTQHIYMSDAGLHMSNSANQSEIWLNDWFGIYKDSNLKFGVLSNGDVVVNGGSITGSAFRQSAADGRYTDINSAGIHVHGPSNLDIYATNWFGINKDGVTKFCVNEDGSVIMNDGLIVAEGKSQKGDFRDTVYVGSSTGNAPINVTSQDDGKYSSLYGGVLFNVWPGHGTSVYGYDYMHLESRGNSVKMWTNSIGLYANNSPDPSVYFNCDGNAWAYHWNIYSLKEFKQNISELPEGQALAVVNTVDIRAYRYKKEAEQGNAKLSYGPIIGDGYTTPEQMLSADGRGTDDHSALYLNMAATQDLFKKYQDAIARIASLEYEVAQLKGAAA